MVTATRTHPPVVTYHAQAETIVISHGFPIISVLRAGGYTFHAFTKTWRRKATAEQFATDWDLLQALGVVADPETAALLTKPAEKLVQPPRQAIPTPTTKTLNPLEGLKLAKEKLCRLAASGRINSADDLATLREVAVAIKALLDAEAAVIWQDVEYGWHEEEAGDFRG